MGEPPRIGLTEWFRARMLPLVVATGVVLALAAPAAFYLRERWDIGLAAQGQADRAAEVIQRMARERPDGWRDPDELAERMALAGLGGATLSIEPDGGRPIALGPRPPRSPIWRAADATLAGRRLARVRAAADHGKLALEAVELAGGALLLALALAAVLYRLPLAAIGRAERRIEQLLGRLALTLQEEDRRGIARDLHDGAGQAITAARLELQAHRARLDGPALARIVGHLDQAMAEVRRSTDRLAPPALAELGLTGALERCCEAFADAARLEVSCQVQPELPPLGAELETACYRIVQEALTNTARHAGARHAWVKLQAGAGALTLEVSDDGSGFGEPPSAGRGIDNIRERARLLGGAVRLSGPERRGARLEVTLPVEPR